jgi:hypothetical protein
MVEIAMSKTLFPLFILALVGMTLSSPMRLHAYELVNTQLTPVSVPVGLNTDILSTNPDLDRDGSPESLQLTSGRLAIISSGKIGWSSPKEWNVIQAGFTDLNGDGSNEVTLLVWRPFLPWPVDQWLRYGGRISNFQNIAGYSCQLILIGWKSGVYREIWAGSALAEPVAAFLAADLDHDGNQELVTLEKKYSDEQSSPARVLKAWKWNGFGFTLVSRVDGIITKMTLAQASDGHNLILVP